MAAKYAYQVRKHYLPKKRKDPRKRKRKGPKYDILETKMEKLMDSKDSETNSFGTYVGQKLEQIESGQREIAEKLISDVLFLAKTNNLRFDSRIDTPSISRFPYYNPDLPHFSLENSNTNIYQSTPYSQYGLQTDHPSISPQTMRMVDSSHTQTPNTSQIAEPSASPSSDSSHNIEAPSRSLSQYPQQSTLHHSSQIAQPNILPSANYSHIQLPPPQSPPPYTQHPQQSPVHNSSQIFEETTKPFTKPMTSPIDV